MDSHAVLRQHTAPRALAKPPSLDLVSSHYLPMLPKVCAEVATCIKVQLCLAQLALIALATALHYCALGAPSA
jgi:hypothetical protein